MKKNMPGGIRCATLRLLADITTKVANRKFSHSQLERFSKGQNPFDGSVIDWVEVYELLGLSDEYAKFAKANKGLLVTKFGFWVTPTLEGVTCNKLIEAYRELGIDMSLYTEDLDGSIVKNDRDPNKTGSYVVAFASKVEADEEFKNKSANDLEKKGVKGITLLERLLLGIGYHLTTGKYLDETVSTLCSGSRYSGGNVPHVNRYVDARKVYVDRYSPEHAHDHLRARAAA